MESFYEKIKIIRKATGASLIDCKRVLSESEGNVEKALGLLKSTMMMCGKKKSCFQSKKGAVFCVTNDDFSEGILLELLCETDFVAKNDEFLGVLKNIAKFCLYNKIDSISKLNSFGNIVEFGNVCFESFCCMLTVKFGENIKLECLEYIVAVNGVIGSYVHFRDNIPVFCSLVVLGNDDICLANDLAVHVVANNPIVVCLGDLPFEVVEKEMNDFKLKYFLENLCQPSKEVVDDFIIKFFQGDVLLYQPFVFNTAETVNSLLIEKKNCVVYFKVFKIHS